MSDATVSHREFERKRLVAQDNMAAEKLRRKEEAEVQKREELKYILFSFIPFFFFIYNSY